VTLRDLDLELVHLMRTRGHWPPFERAVIAFSKLGEHSAIWFAVSAAGFAVDPARRPVYARLARTVTAVEVVNAVAKIVIGRRRPRLAGLPPLTSTRSQRSFPSAHSATSFAAAQVLSRTFPAPGVYALAAAMALSRPYLGVHYPSDVLGGAVMGTLIARQFD
jgi:undecaprenyl-diphosphatase